MFFLADIYNIFLFNDKYKIILYWAHCDILDENIDLLLKD